MNDADFIEDGGSSGIFIRKLKESIALRHLDAKRDRGSLLDWRAE